MVVVRPPERVYRIARGPSVFDPIPWEYTRADGTFDGRFDDPSGQASPWRNVILPPNDRFRVVYCSTQRAGAFGETVAQFRESIQLLALMQDVIDEERALSNNPPGVIPAHWRAQRRVGTAALDPSLQFVDISAAATMTHLREVLARQAAHLGLNDIDLSAVTGAQRLLTQEASRYINECCDKDGVPLYAGIRYLSRLHSQWECFAVFADRMEHVPYPQESIFPNDPGLVEAASVLGLVLPETF